MVMMPRPSCPDNFGWKHYENSDAGNAKLWTQFNNAMICSTLQLNRESRLQLVQPVKTKAFTELLTALTLETFLDELSLNSYKIIFARYAAPRLDKQDS